MRCLPIALLLLGLASGGPALADQTPAQSAAGEAPAPEAEDPTIVVEGETSKDKRRVCETRVSTGSIMPKRVCRTVAQIEQEERVAREAIERTNRDRETRDATQRIRESGG
jgi:hypothetical protein